MICPGTQKLHTFKIMLTVARVVRERLREPLVRRARSQTGLAGAAEVHLDRVEAPRGEAVGVLLIVAERTDPLTVATARAGVGVDPSEQTVPVQPAGQPFQAVRPLAAVDHRSRRAGPADRWPSRSPATRSGSRPAPGRGAAATWPRTGSSPRRRLRRRRNRCSSPCTGRQPERVVNLPLGERCPHSCPARQRSPNFRRWSSRPPVSRSGEPAAAGTRSRSPGDPVTHVLDPGSECPRLDELEVDALVERRKERRPST